MDSDCKGWTLSDNYPFLRIPYTNGVNLQWTVRDNNLKNVPVSLLVKGDVIKLRPGQVIFAECEINDGDDPSNEYSKKYVIGDTFVSNKKDEKNEKINFSDKSHPRVISMKRCVTATVTQTPIVSFLEEFLVNYSSKDTWSVSVPERYIEYSINAQLIYILILCILNVLAHIMWFILIGKHHKSSWPSTTSYITLVGVPFHVPFLLFLTMSNNVWKINCLLYKVDRRSKRFISSETLERIPSSISIHSNDSYYSKPIDVTTDTLSVNRVQHVRAIWNQFICQDHQFQGMIYNLGSLTSLCCVDKKGILADPIVTPEKIFIYRKRHRHRSNSLMNLDKIERKKLSHHHDPDMPVNVNTIIDSVPNVRMRSLTCDNAQNSFDLNIGNIMKVCSTKVSTRSPSMLNHKLTPLVHIDSSLAIPVILDITSGTTNRQLPSFDDSRWERYLSSLKPIGINILLNNCNPEVSDRYINFTDNISAINFKNLNKSQLTHRCFCALASQIGFKEGAVEPYQLVTTFAACRQNSSQTQKLSSGATISNVYQPPVSNVLSTVVRDRVKNSHQLMSQGSADMLLSMCTDYWDGKDISSLTRFDRSRVLDFYNRNIFSSYCIAFAYSPIINRITLNEMGDQFILMMPELKDRIKDSSSTANFVNKSQFRGNTAFNNSHSEQIKMNFPTSKANRMAMLKQVEDVENLLNHQIFLGMVSMQADQVQSDVIDSINRLEQACIRFVFFSVDNQLRSRVFAERLGMESGWNCHISLADPAAIRRKSSLGVEKFSLRQIKESYDADIASKEDFLYRAFSYSEPILHSSHLESDQIAHSTTLPDAELSIIPKLQVKDCEDSKKTTESCNLSDSSSSITSTTDSLKERDTFMDDPQDHFREDKSKLPCGINSIRPHLENVDNVPLQVSLFTDCNPEVDQKMMDIMREYGEVICCCGSSLNLHNLPLFSSSDCAVAFIPILHKKCSKQRETKCQEESNVSKSFLSNKDHVVPEDEPLLNKKSMFMDNVSLPALSPINMASRLVGMPCALIFDRTKGFHLITFISECHRLIKNSLSAIAFYCLFCASFALLKLLINMFVIFFDYYYSNVSFFLGLDLFPRKAHIVYHFYCHSIVLAFTIYTRSDLVGKPLKEPPRKRIRILKFKQCRRFILASAGRLLPSVTLCAFVFVWNVLILYPLVLPDRLSGNVTILTLEQLNVIIPNVLSDFVFVQYNLYIIIVSLFYLTLEKQVWKFNCLKNFLWPLVASTLTAVQLLYLVVSWNLQQYPDIYMLLWTKLFFPIIISFCGILIVFVGGLISNHWEFKAQSVEHRLARLYFGTKLGMYSPV